MTSPAAPHDQEVSLLDQIRWVVAGHQVDDVMVIAVMLLIECLVQRTHTKTGALLQLMDMHFAIADEIDTNYSEIKPALTGMVVT